MSEEENNTQSEEETEAQSKIEIDANTYGALLDRIAELEDMTSARPTQQNLERSPIDELADEGRSHETQESVITPPKDLDEMSNAQLVDFIFTSINQQAAGRIDKIEVAVETLRVAREIDKAESKYSDFWLYGDQVKKIALANPALSIERAYHLAKAENPKKQESSDKTKPREPTRTEKLLHLPTRTFGEKPTVATASTSETKRGLGREEAAKRAWDEVVGPDKQSV